MHDNSASRNDNNLSDIILDIYDGQNNDDYSHF